MVAREAPPDINEQILREVLKGQAPPPLHHIRRVGPRQIRAQPEAQEPSHDLCPASDSRARLHGLWQARRPPIDV